MKQHKEAERPYNPIEPAYGGHDVIKMGTKTWAGTHKLFGIITALALAVALGSRILRGAHYSSATLAAFVAAVLILSSFYFSFRRKNE